MNMNRKLYPEGHWLRSQDPERALEAYMDQQSKAYSRVKNAYIRDLVGNLEGKHFLDYGCGGGMFVVHAAEGGAVEVVGVDAESGALAAAKHFARREGVEQACRFILSETFPSLIGRPRFDVILMKDVLEHVADDEDLLLAARKALAPGGSLVLSTQNSLSLNYLLEGTYRRTIQGNKEWCGWDDTHLRFYTPMSLGRKLKRAGFGSFSWRSVYLVPYKLPALRLSHKEFLRLDALSWIDRALGRVFPYNRVGWNVIVRAKVSPLVPHRIDLGEPVHERLAAAPLMVTREALRFDE
ncbi:MAG: methyltransferase domain-containing protein [Desulfomonile tiedjei]|nr:methyltransferase domain-containing protein [Desulfomonile tiedjei]